MDDRRFDNAVRALARHRSRRGLVGGLLGGGAALIASHLRVPGAAARHRHVPQGDWCVDDDQCDPWLECRWNGYGSAGGACCAFPGGACDDDFGCCDTATCFGGFCTEMTSAPSPGEPCQVDGNPCVYASGYFYCGYVEQFGDFLCCTDEGGAAAAMNTAAARTPASAASAPARARVPAPAASPGSGAETRTAIHHGNGAATRVAAFARC